MKNTKKDEVEVKSRRKSTRNSTASSDGETPLPPAKIAKVDDLKQISDDTKNEINQKQTSNKQTKAEEKPSVGTERKNVPENLARKVINLEEEDAKKRDSAIDLTEFQNTCTNIEKRVSNINEIKKKNKSMNKSADEISENKLDAILLTTNLKRLNRLTQIRGKLAKESTQEVKKKVDGLHLDLQNLLYEVMHVKKEIQKCMNFSSKDEEIDLVPVEKFYEEAPASICQPKITKINEHSQMLARLDWELKRRKELSSEKQSLVTTMKKTEGEINQKSDYLCNLKPRLEQIIKASRPVQEYMEIPLEAEAMLWEKAQYLPRPLYILYIQAKAYKDVCDKNLDVLITGDLVEAKNSFLADDIDAVESGESETENEADGDEDSTSRKHKKDKIRLNEQQNQLLRVHPLSISLEITEKDVYKIKLKFNHIPALYINTVTVQLQFVKDPDELEKSMLLSPSNILRDLISIDDGRDTPNPANVYQLKRLKMEPFTSYIATLGTPYFWVQWICGINYMPNNDLSNSVPDASLSVKHFQNVIKKIKSRMRSRLSLNEQLQSLEQLVIPESKKETMKDFFPSKLVSTLSSWTLSTYEEFCKLDCSSELEELNVVDEYCFFYQATLNREEEVKVDIVLHHDYPKKPPLVLLSLKDNSAAVNVKSDLKCVESEVNSYTEELTNKDDENMLLSNMITRLQVGFDMFCETGAQKKSKERLYSRKFRGRDRNRPYRYKEDGYFVHR